MKREREREREIGPVIRCGNSIMWERKREREMLLLANGTTPPPPLASYGDRYSYKPMPVPLQRKMFAIGKSFDCDQLM